jgi:phosphoribosylformylglycinamidine synthase
VKAGWLPRTEPGASATQEATLAANDSGRFEARWIWLEVTTDRSPFLRKGDRLLLPTAHGEGKFLVADAGVRARMDAQGQVALRYVDEDGRPGGYPVNPSGSEDGVAGVCDPSGRVLGLMPHPERHVEFHHHPRWTRLGLRPGHEGDGLRVFRSAIQYFKGN